MKLPRFLLTLSFFTILSLLYVYQQNQIYQLAYDGEKQRSAFQDLLDKNNTLRYNIQRNSSLIRIGNKISRNQDYEIPDAYRLVKLSHPLESLKVKLCESEKETLLSRIFGIKTEAEARTINPQETFHSKSSVLFEVR